MGTVYDWLVQDAVDLHCHIDVEFSTTAFRKAMPEWEWLPRAEVAGMRGVLLKSHLWPTTTALPYIRQLYQGPVEVFGSITLNPASGGLDPWVVESAVQMGAKAVFMPTWGSLNDHNHGGFGSRLQNSFEHFDGGRLARLTVLDAGGELTAEAREIVRVAKDYDVMLSTGHLSAREALGLVAEAKKVGHERIVFSHPLSVSVGASAEAVREAAANGAFIEFCWPTIAPGRHSPSDVVGLINEVGSSRVLLTTDFFGGSQPSPSDLMRMFLGALYDAGLSEETIKHAAAVNPARLVGINS